MAAEAAEAAQAGTKQAPVSGLRPKTKAIQAEAAEQAVAAEQMETADNRAELHSPSFCWIPT